MPQIESFGLLGSLGKEKGYTRHDTGDGGKLRVRLYYILNLTKLLYNQVLINSG